MWVTYTPAGETKRTWLFRTDDLDEEVAEEIEKKAGCLFGEFIEALINGGARARRTLVWHLLVTNEHPSLRFEELKLKRGELDFDLDDEELERGRKKLGTAAANAELDEEIERVRAEFGSVGKALCSPNGSGTS